LVIRGRPAFAHRSAHLHAGAWRARTSFAATDEFMKDLKDDEDPAVAALSKRLRGEGVDADQQQCKLAVDASLPTGLTLTDDYKSGASTGAGKYCEVDCSLDGGTE
jgi:hypothetical protein